MSEEVLVAEPTGNGLSLATDSDDNGNPSSGQSQLQSQSGSDSQSANSIIELFGRVFEENDLNHDGVIDFSEWTNIIRNNKELGLSFISNKDSGHIFQTLTTDGKNIDYKKFVSNMKEFQQSHAKLSGDDFLMSFLAAHYEHSNSPLPGQTVSQSVPAPNVANGMIHTIHEQGRSPSVLSSYGDNRFISEQKDAQIADLRSKIQEMEKYQTKCNQLEFQLDQKDNTISALQSELNFKEEELQVYKQNKQDLDADNENLRSANSELHLQINQLTESFSQVEAMLKESEDEANKSNTEAYEKHLKQTNALLETEKKLNEQLQNDISKMSDTQNKLSKRISSLASQYEQTKKQLDDILNENIQLKEHNNNLEIKMNNLEADVNELENALQEKEQEYNNHQQNNNNNNDLDGQFPSTFDDGPPARSRARTSIAPAPNVQGGVAGVAGAQTPAGENFGDFTLIRHQTWDSNDFSNTLDDIVDEVDNDKLDKWRRLRSQAVEKRRQSRMLHSRDNSALSALNLFSPGGTGIHGQGMRISTGFNTEKVEKLFEEMNNKVMKQFGDFRSSMEVDFKELKDLYWNMDKTPRNASARRDSIEDKNEKDSSDSSLQVPQLANQLSNLEKAQKENAEHVRNQTTELIEDFQSEMDDKAAKMDELISLMSTQFVEQEHQTQNYLDAKMDQLLDRLKEHLAANNNNNNRSKNDVDEEETKDNKNDNSNNNNNNNEAEQSAGLIDEFSKMLKEQIGTLESSIMKNNEYNKETLYHGIENITNTLTNFGRYFNVTNSSNNVDGHNIDANDRSLSFFGKIGELLQQSQTRIMQHTTDEIHSSSPKHENLVREYEEKLDVESTNTPASNDLIDAIVSDKVKTIEILGKQMDVLREQIKFAQSQNTTLSDIAKKQQSSMQQIQNQSFLSKLGFGAWSNGS